MTLKPGEEEENGGKRNHQMYVNQLIKYDRKQRSFTHTFVNWIKSCL